MLHAAAPKFTALADDAICLSLRIPTEPWAMHKQAACEPLQHQLSSSLHPVSVPYVLTVYLVAGTDAVEALSPAGVLWMRICFPLSSKVLQNCTA
jgi:hypothetical protein